MLAGYISYLNFTNRAKYYQSLLESFFLFNPSTKNKKVLRIYGGNHVLLYNGKIMLEVGE